MEPVVKKLDPTSNLILHRTPQSEIRGGITVIVRARAPGSTTRRQALPRPGRRGDAPVHVGTAARSWPRRPTTRCAAWPTSRHELHQRACMTLAERLAAVARATSGASPSSATARRRSSPP